MANSETLAEQLKRTKRVLEVLEEQVAGYTALEVPAHKVVEIEEQRKKVNDIELKLKGASSETQQASQSSSEVQQQAPIRSRVSDENYIERSEAKRLLEAFSSALLQPKTQPFLFNIFGIGGVGKTTLLRRLKEIHSDSVDYLDVCFAKTPNIETPLKLMRRLHEQLVQITGIEPQYDPFAQKDEQFEEALFRLSRTSISGELNNSEESRKITSWFERLIWLGSTDVTSRIGESKLLQSSDSGFSNSIGIEEDSERLKEWIHQRVRNHPSTKDQPELQSLMLEPVSRLTQAFAESLMKVSSSREKALLITLDTYEKAQPYLNQWLWQYLVEDTTLYTASVRIMIVGRRSLQNDEGWRKINQDRKLLYETQLKKFGRKDTEGYLKQIGIEERGKWAKIYKITQGLPYYLNWIRRQRESGEEPDFSKGNQAIAELLLQGLDIQQRKFLQVVACCRWFDLSILRYLLESNNIILEKDIVGNAEEWLEWLKKSDFIELSKGHYRLDDVARDIFRQSYYQDDRSEFRKTNILLSDYFEEKANKVTTSHTLLPESFHNEDWRELCTEFLYYGFLGKGNEGLRQYIEYLLIAVYVREPDVFLAPFSFISSEINEGNKRILPNETTKFLKVSKTAFRIGWFFLDTFPILSHSKVESERSTSSEVLVEKIEESLTALLNHVDIFNLPDGIGKCVGFIYKTIRCNDPSEKSMFLSQSKYQIELAQDSCTIKLAQSIFLTLGRLLIGEDSYEESLECYQAALSLKKSATALHGKGFALGALERNEQALKSFQGAVEIDPSFDLAWENMGIVFHKLGRREEAIDCFRKAVDIDSKFWTAWYNLASALSEAGREREALESIEEMIELNFDSAEAWGTKGDLLSNFEEYEDALISFEESLKIKAENPGTWHAKSNALRSLRRYEEALVASDLSLRESPKNPIFLNAKALTLSLLESFDESIPIINAAIKIDPKEVLYVANKGIILARAKRYDAALAECNKAIKKELDNESGYYAKACCYAVQGETELAINFLSEAVGLSERRVKREARQNSDFDSIRDSVLFQQLICG